MSDFKQKFSYRLIETVENFLNTWLMTLLIIPLLMSLPFVFEFMLPKFIKIDDYESCKWILKNKELCYSGWIGLIGYSSRLISLTASLTTKSIMKESKWYRKLIDTISSIVEAKSKRFLKIAKESYEKHLNAHDIFWSITKPDDQISTIIEAYAEYYKILYEGVIFKVALMQITEKRPVKWEAHYPHAAVPKTSIKELLKKNSSIMRAIQSQDVIIIPNTRKELELNPKKSNMVQGSLPQEFEGSLLTFPIHCPNTRQIIYTLSITADKKDVFNTNDKKLYKWIQTHFSTRIILEHHLQLLMDTSYEKTSKA